MIYYDEHTLIMVNLIEQIETYRSFGTVRTVLGTMYIFNKIGM